MKPKIYSRGTGLWYWLVGVVLVISMFGLCFGEEQKDENSPQVTFREPVNESSIGSDIDVIIIRFRIFSPDGTKLMRYEVLVDGIQGTLEPIPIDPPKSEVELAVEWRGVKNFPDGIHLITIKVTDAKGREGSGTLTIYKGHDQSKPNLTILQPHHGDIIRGKVPFLIRIEDDRALKSLSVSAKQKESSKRHVLYLRTLQGRLMEVQFVWDTTLTDPQTQEPLFPDGLYVLQGKAIDQDGNEGLSGEVLVFVQNQIAQPVISQSQQMPPQRGGAIVTPLSPIVSRHFSAENLKLALPEASLLATTLAVYPKLKSSVLKLMVLLPAVELRTRHAISFHPPQQMPKTTSLKPKPRLSSTLLPKVANIQSPSKIPQVTHKLPAETTPISITVTSSSQRSGLSSVSPMLVSPKEQPLVCLPTETTKKLALSVLPEQRRSSINPMTSPIERSRPEVVLYDTSHPTYAPLPKTDLKITSVTKKAVLSPLPFVERKPESATKVALSSSPTVERKTGQVLTSLQNQIHSHPEVLIRPVHRFYYTVIAGDTLEELAKRFGVTVQQLEKANSMVESSSLKIGQRLLIPVRTVIVSVDNKTIQSPIPSFLYKGITVGSLRAVIEANDGTVDWDNSKKQTTAIVGKLMLKATVGQDWMEVNGEHVSVGISSFLLGNRFFLPLRPLGQALGKVVEWQDFTVKMKAPDN